MYITKDQVKKYHGINWSAGLDTFIDTLIAAAQSYIENYTERKFEAPDPDTAVTRYFNGNDGTSLPIGDLRELTSLVVDGVTLTNETDFYLYPLNAEEDSKPYTRIELIQPETRLNASPRLDLSSPYVFERAQRNVAVTGKWGYSATAPADVQVAAMKLVGGMIKENIGDNDLREVKSETLGEYSVTYESIKQISGLLGVDALLDQYALGKDGRGDGIVRAGIIKVS